MGMNGDQHEGEVRTATLCEEGPKQEAKSEKSDMRENREERKTSFTDVVHETGLVAAKTMAGVGIGAVTGIGAIVAISVAEVTLPALLVLKTFSLAGGALGFLKGVNKK